MNKIGALMQLNFNFQKNLNKIIMINFKDTSEAINCNQIGLFNKTFKIKFRNRLNMN